MYYIIEHPTRGTLKEYDAIDDKFRFSVTGPRSDGDTAVQFQSLDAANAMLSRVYQNAKKPRMHNLTQSKVRRSSDWFWHCTECGGWIGSTSSAYREFGHDGDCPIING